ncbi:hypothetical protein HYS91_01995 [Candidatus Daviesbacteria bacterium]|nr:hypothetical protein [Candidatus Daviesbacteria bacterium]
MENHQAEAIVVTCIDFRLQEYINEWLSQKFSAKTFDRVAFAGGVKNIDTILTQIEIANKLHHIKKAVLINHEDCGAYGELGTVKKHTQDLRNAAAKIKEQFPNLEVDTYYLHLDGRFEPIT